MKRTLDRVVGVVGALFTVGLTAVIGLLTTKTDARGITVNYNPSESPIDALHRVTKQTFSNGDPSISYFYDQTSYNGLTITNGIGRRTGMSDAAGAEAWSYDAMGRALADRRTTNSVTKTTSYTYNLDGSAVTLTYPSTQWADWIMASPPCDRVDLVAADFAEVLNGSLPHRICSSQRR